MLTVIYLMGGLGLLVGVGLAVASKIFYVYVDPIVEAIEGALPGANCGGCGLPGCSANAAAIAAGKASPSSCVAAGEDTAQAIANILGVSVEAKEPDVSLPGCRYSTDRAETVYIYNGLKDCRAASFLSGGMKECSIGCLGLGSCIAACKFNAISMGKDGLPIVDEQKCTGCGACEKVCPKNIINLTSITKRILHEYTVSECTTPCQRACPAGINIEKYIRLISMGDYKKAVQVIKERNPFPTVIGRICPRPCEDQCRRGLVDEPVAINFLKRFVSDYEKENGRTLPYKAPETGKKIAIIGAGAQGLSAAFFLARLGHSPTVFEAEKQAGGMLKKAIAKERLPIDILNWDIEGIIEMGVSIKTEKTAGIDFSVDSLLGEDFEAVFLAAGGSDSRMLRKGKEKPMPGIFTLLDITDQDVKLGKDVAVACNRLISKEAAEKIIERCKNLGAKNITFIVSDNEAGQEKTLSCIKGSVSRIFGRKGNLMEIEYIGEDDNLNKTEKKKIKADNLIIDSGRCPEFIFKMAEYKEKSEEGEIDPEFADIWEAFLPLNHTLLDENQPITDYSSTVSAIAAGRKAAASIHRAIYSIEDDILDEVITPKSVLPMVTSVEGVTTVPRRIMPVYYENGVETEKGFTEEMAISEALRCLQCGLTCYNKN